MRVDTIFKIKKLEVPSSKAQGVLLASSFHMTSLTLFCSMKWCSWKRKNAWKMKMEPYLKIFDLIKQSTNFICKNLDNSLRIKKNQRELKNWTFLAWKEKVKSCWKKQDHIYCNFGLKSRAGQSWALSVFFNFFNNKKWLFTFFIKLIWLGVGILN